MAMLQSYKPTSWSLLLDWRCIYTCPMCPFHGEGYTGDYWKNRQKQRTVVPLETAKWRIDLLKHYGASHLSLISSGEIFLYPYWKDVADYAKDLGFSLGTTTNGAMITPELCQELIKHGFTNISVSHDAITFETYKQVRSADRKNFEAAMKAPEMLTDAGLKVNVHFVQQDANIHEKQQYIDMWKNQILIHSQSDHRQYTMRMAHAQNETHQMIFSFNHFALGLVVIVFMSMGQFRSVVNRKRL